MLATRLCSAAASASVRPASVAVLVGAKLPASLGRARAQGAQLVRLYAQDARSGFARHAERRRAMGLKEAAMSPTKGTPFIIGHGAVAGGAALGLGALCFYGMGLSSEPGAVEKRMVWPQYVKDRIRDTYLYFGASVGVTAASAVAAFRSPALMNLVTQGGWLAFGATIAVMIGSQILVRSIPYEPGLGTKQLAWLAHSGLMGVIVAPMCVLGGPLLTRAALYTAGIVGGLSTVAACAPSDKFLYMGGPLAMGFGVVFAASMGSYFMAPTTALGAGLYSVSLYGGLLLFSGFMLYDTQKIVHKAEVVPQNATFDPINSSIGIYIDTLNIFIRIAQILASGGGGRRK